jgi:hypothetical protein
MSRKPEFFLLPVLTLLVCRIVCSQTQAAATAPPQTLVESSGGEPQTESLTTDRAEYTITTEVVGPGILQLETGGLLEYSPSARVIHAPTPLMRIGLTRSIELRVGGDGALWQRSGSPGAYDHASGISDVGVELKWKLLAEGGYRPAVAIAPSVSTPVGRRGFTSTAYDPAFKLAWAKGLAGGFRASGNFNVSSLTEEQSRFLQRAASLCIEHNLPGGLVAYWENYTIWPRHRSGERESMWNTGLFRGIGKNAQVDVEVARCFASPVPHWYLGAGFVIRLPGALWRK